MCRPGADDVLVLRQELIKTQTLMDALNQDHDKERDHLTNELLEVRRKLQLCVHTLVLGFESLPATLRDLSVPRWLRQGFEKTRFLKAQPSGFYWVLGFFSDKQEKIGKIIQKLSNCLKSFKTRKYCINSGI